MLNEAISPLQSLEFLLAAGVDIALGDEAINRLPDLAEPQSAVPGPTPRERPSSSGRPIGDGAGPAPRPPRPATAPPAGTVAPEEAIMAARALAASAPDLATLEALLNGFEGCALKNTASRLVFADGNPQARLMIVGEAPGRDEDEIGRPFVGRAGQLLTRMLAAIGLGRDDVYIANTVPWRPPGNRTPTPQEIAILQPFITRQIELCAPAVLFTLGGPATQTLLGQKEGILRLRGRWFDYACGERRIPALASLHPAYLLRQPAQKALAWRDLRALKARLDGLA